MPPEARFRARHFEALGTVCALFGVGVDPHALEAGEQWVRGMGARFTRFSPDSELSQVNAAAGRWVETGVEMDAMLGEALRAYEMSFGLVNVAVLPAMHAIGYSRPLASGIAPAAAVRPEPPPPLPGVLELRRGGARLRPGCALDFGGIAKGWMAERLSAWLGGNVLVNLGGDLYAAGRGPEGGGWPVGVGAATVLLRDSAAATSSVRKRRWGALHHLIDPRTGLPSDTGLDEVSVVARSGVAAEVVAKTALLLGPELAPAFCSAHALAWSLTRSDDR